MTTKPKAERPAAQPGTPLGIADVRIAIEALRQEDVEPALAILAELHDSMAEREAPAPNCPVCDEAVDTNRAGNVIAIHSMCLPKVRFGEAPAQTAGADPVATLSKVEAHRRRLEFRAAFCKWFEGPSPHHETQDEGFLAPAQPKDGRKDTK
jgi:hypothetical protein